MREQDEDAAWRAIVENYGDRPQFEADPNAPGTPSPDADPITDDDPDGGVDTLHGPLSGETSEGPPDPPSPDLPAGPPHANVLNAPTERFVPPPPPPLPRPRGPRGLAWVALLGTPLLLLVLLVTDIYLPRFAAWSMAAAFLTGFAYLVWTMPHGPRDPSDDGARV